MAAKVAIPFWRCMAPELQKHQQMSSLPLIVSEVCLPRKPVNPQTKKEKGQPRSRNSRERRSKQGDLSFADRLAVSLGLDKHPVAQPLLESRSSPDAGSGTTTLGALSCCKSIRTANFDANKRELKSIYDSRVADVYTLSRRV